MKTFIILVTLSCCLICYEAKKSHTSSKSSSGPGTNAEANAWAEGDNAESSSSSMTSECSNGVCKTCFGSKCYPRSFSSVSSQSGCPTAACDDDCSGMETSGDNCPICKCNGYSTREPCNSSSDCGSGGSCSNNLCRYK